MLARRYHDMCAVSRTDARDVLDVYNDAIRRTLLAAKGYECQVGERECCRL